MDIEFAPEWLAWYDSLDLRARIRLSREMTFEQKMLLTSALIERDFAQRRERLRREHPDADEDSIRALLRQQLDEEDPLEYGDA
ncbi:MAG: hypothetical protein QM770_06175 [Tepidisphaeraceae bacterium]